jgi:hypothetical protein
MLFIDSSAKQLEKGLRELPVHVIAQNVVLITRIANSMFNPSFFVPVI